MFIPVELVLKSYMPRNLEKGMWFITKLYQNTDKEYIEVWALDKLPKEPIEEFITTHGAPVEPYLIYDEQVIAEPHEIGWWDEDPYNEELRDITLKDINLILTEYDGEIDIEVDDYELIENEKIVPILYSDKVTLCIPGMYEEEEEDDEWEEDEDDDQ